MVLGFAGTIQLPSREMVPTRIGYWLLNAFDEVSPLVADYHYV
jgi:hypothetical protein